MQTTLNKPNIKILPTPQTYFYKIGKEITKLQTKTNIQKFIIYLLILWNIIITVTIYKPVQESPIPVFTDHENQLIMQLEEIPEL